MQLWLIGGLRDVPRNLRMGVDQSKLLNLVEEVMEAHELREDVPRTRLIRRPFKHRPRPKTSIISQGAERARRKRVMREWLTAVAVDEAQLEHAK